MSIKEQINQEFREIVKILESNKQDVSNLIKMLRDIFYYIDPNVSVKSKDPGDKVMNSVYDHQGKKVNTKKLIEHFEKLFEFLTNISKNFDKFEAKKEGLKKPLMELYEQLTDFWKQKIVKYKRKDSKSPVWGLVDNFFKNFKKFIEG